MDWLNDILGLQAEKLTAMHMASRAVVVFIVCLVYIRIAGLRTFGKHSSFDQLTALIFGAIMGRAVVSNSSFPGALLATLIVVLLHRLVAFATFKSHRIGYILKGEPLLLWRNGKLEKSNAGKANISIEDMQEAMRVLLTINDLDQVKEIYLERSGEISVIKKEDRTT